MMPIELKKYWSYCYDELLIGPKKTFNVVCSSFESKKDPSCIWSSNVYTATQPVLSLYVSSRTIGINTEYEGYLCDVS